MKTVAPTKTTDNSTAQRFARSRSAVETAPVFNPAAASALPLQRKAACPCGGGCPACRAKPNDLKVSQPNDPAEIEADQIADEVMRMPVGEATQQKNGSGLAGIQNQIAVPSIHRKCSACEEDDEAKIQRKPLSSVGGVPLQSPAHVHSAINSGGRPLDAETRNFFEPRFGYDLGSVRIHTGDRAEQSANAIVAKAYTLGSNLVFGSGEYQPHSESGRRLIAHELAHIMQQGTGKIQELQRQQAEESATEDRSAPSRSTVISEAEVCPPSEGMTCTPATNSPDAVTNSIAFSQNEHMLNRRQQEEIEAAAASWNDAGRLGTVRIDGYASAEGECSYNWELSCRRAQSVATVLEHPADSLGVPSVSIELFAHGEGNEFGSALPENRKATISMPVASMPVAPPPSLPAPDIDEDPCSEEHGTEARIAIDNAYHAIRRTVHRINSDYEGTEDDIRYYFGESYDRGAISLRFGELLSFLRERVILSCADPSSDPECRPDVLAYCHSRSPLISRVFNDRTIHVCQPNFHDLTASMRIATMVHEAAHLYLGMDDNAAYSNVDCRATGPMVVSDRDLSLNADSYGCLVYRLGGRNP